MTSPAKHRAKRSTTPAPGDDKVLQDHVETIISDAKIHANNAITNEWDYKLALAVVTALAFATRFYGITHPDQVVFDEVHFGKVGPSTSRPCMY